MHRAVSPKICRIIRCGPCIILLASLVAGCGGGGLGKAASRAGSEASGAASQAAGKADAIEAPSARSALHYSSEASAAGDSATVRDWLEGRAANDSDFRAVICRRYDDAQRRSEPAPDQAYDALASTEGFVSGRASFMSMWESVNGLADGDLKELAGIFC